MRRQRSRVRLSYDIEGFVFFSLASDKQSAAAPFSIVRIKSSS